MGCRDAKQKQLEKEGYKLVCITSEPRLSEICELYRELGFEVRLESADCVYDESVCKSCILGDREKIKAVYIKEH